MVRKLYGVDRGPGHSQYTMKTLWQTDGLCPMRTVADVSADADPGTARYTIVFLVLVSVAGLKSGYEFRCPIIAGVYALAGYAGGVFCSKYFVLFTLLSNLFK